MGGFVVDLDDGLIDEHPRFAEKINRLTFTPKGIALLAKCGYPPRISRGEILDKSKIDGLGKSFACIQALWMTTQVCTRLIAGLPVTLLEVMTLGHVLCALVLYMMCGTSLVGFKSLLHLKENGSGNLCVYVYGE